MRKAIFVMAVLAMAGTAMAGEIKVTAGPDANLTQYQRVRPIADADLTSRVIPALKWNYGQICVDDDANPQTPCVMQDRTNTQAVDAWLKSVNDGLNDIIKRYDTQQAIDGAIAGLPPLP